MSIKRIGLAGHAGIGHVHCPGGLIQDDSGGFATVGLIIRGKLGADTHVREVDVSSDTNTISITTMDGGVGEASPRRGITPKEAELIKGVIGHDALFCQALAIGTLGRIYGQGVLETPVALMAALANAVVDTFYKKSPGTFSITRESIRINNGLIGGISTEFNGIATSAMITVNTSSGGLGPDEDMEGNIPLGSKGELMKKLDMLRCPTIIVEGKAYFQSLSDSLHQNTFVVRLNEDLDNMVVARALYDSAKELHCPIIFINDAFPAPEGMLKQNTIQLAEKIIKNAEDLKKAELSSDKVLLVAELAKLVSEDAGGVTFMSNKIHDLVRGVGSIPGTSACLSMLVTKSYIEHWKVPFIEEEDVEMARAIIYAAIPRIAANIDEAYEIIDKLYVNLGSLEQFVG